MFQWGGTSKSSVLDWDFRSSTIHDGVSPFMETSISPNGPNVHQKLPDTRQPDTRHLSIDWFCWEKLQENPMIFMGKSMVSG